MVEEGLPLPFNPVKDTATNSPASRDKVSEIASELRPIWTALPPPGDDYGDMVRLLFLCGSRRMEIAALDRAEVNFEARQIELQGMRTKSRRPHFVPLSEPALAILKARASRTGFMFGCNGNVFSAWSFYKKELDARSGVANWVLHDARRLLASSLVEKESLIRRSSRTLSRRF